MSQTTMAAIAIALVVGMLGFALWYTQQHPRHIVGYGTLQVRSERAGGGTSTHQTRRIAINAVEFQEVEMLNGTWIDCGGDCARAVRDAGDGFWDKQQRDRR